MKPLANTDNKENWVRCHCCGHKLGRIVTPITNGIFELEIKCHSCKEINTILFMREENNV